jgi:serralysin
MMQAGADTFVFSALSDSAGASIDVLADFSTAQNDKINLSAIDANSLLAGDQAFSWVGTGAFTNVAGQQLRALSRSLEQATKSLIRLW